MRYFPLGPAVLVLFALLIPESLSKNQSANQTPTVDPKATTLLQQSVATMATTAPSDSTATGSVQVVAGSTTSQGTVSILTKGTSETSVQMTMPTGVDTLIYANGQANEVVGTRVNGLSLELAVTSQAPDFPLPLLTAILNDTDMSSQYIGLDSSSGTALQHIKVWDSYASRADMQSLSDLTTRDIWLDPTSGLPQRISYNRCPAQGSAICVAVDVFFSSYQNFQGVLYPTTIQKSFNGTPWATITIQNVSFNTGLTDSDFPIQGQ